MGIFVSYLWENMEFDDDEIQQLGASAGPEIIESQISLRVPASSSESVGKFPRRSPTKVASVADSDTMATETQEKSVNPNEANVAPLSLRRSCRKIKKVDKHLLDSPPHLAKKPKPKASSEEDGGIQNLKLPKKYLNVASTICQPRATNNLRPATDDKHKASQASNTIKNKTNAGKSATATNADTLQVLTEEDVNVTPGVSCAFCKEATVDEVNLGLLYRLEYRQEGNLLGIITHYYCLLLSSYAKQQGKDEEGILGFLRVHILEELGRCQTIECSYCHHNGASINCRNRKCRKRFHFPCGLKNGANYHFQGGFTSSCKDHSPARNLSLKGEDGGFPECPVCLQPVLDSENAIKPGCCQSKIFHKYCLKKSALNEGYLFKCPHCYDKKKFPYEMKCNGIFVPNRDASWETEDNTYHRDLLQRYSNCDAKDCQYNLGRDQSTEYGFWAIARCRICANAGIHMKCGKIRGGLDWTCESCLQIEKMVDHRIAIKNTKLLSVAIPRHPTTRKRRNDSPTHAELASHELAADPLNDDNVPDFEPKPSTSRAMPILTKTSTISSANNTVGQEQMKNIDSKMEEIASSQLTPGPLNDDYDPDFDFVQIPPTSPARPMLTNVKPLNISSAGNTDGKEQTEDVEMEDDVIFVEEVSFFRAKGNIDYITVVDCDDDCQDHGSNSTLSHDLDVEIISNVDPEDLND